MQSKLCRKNHLKFWFLNEFFLFLSTLISIFLEINFNSSHELWRKTGNFISKTWKKTRAKTHLWVCECPFDVVFCHLVALIDKKVCRLTLNESSWPGARICKDYNKFWSETCFCFSFYRKGANRRGCKDASSLIANSFDAHNVFSHRRCFSCLFAVEWVSFFRI